ncbi:DUF2933 domain-containing protein [Sphingobium xenophagum]
MLACPLMHLFMHHGHGSHQHGQDHGNTQSPTALPASSIQRTEGEPR